jgi:hypothetical protein
MLLYQRFLLLMLFCFPVVVCHSQTTTGKEQPAFTPKKSSLKIIFDDSNAQLLSIDTTGKIFDDAIVAFQLFVRIKGVSYSEQALGSHLSQPMLSLLEKTEPNTILYFEHIQVKNERGKLMEAEDFQYTMSYVKKKESKKRKIKKIK